MEETEVITIQYQTTHSQFVADCRGVRAWKEQFDRGDEVFASDENGDRRRILSIEPDVRNGTFGFEVGSQALIEVEMVPNAAMREMVELAGRGEPLEMEFEGEMYPIVAAWSTRRQR